MLINSAANCGSLLRFLPSSVGSRCGFCSPAKKITAILVELERTGDVIADLTLPGTEWSGKGLREEE